MIRYAHTNLIAKDWRNLATFYEEVFGCIPIPPDRDLSGEWLDKAKVCWFFIIKEHTK